MSGYLLLLIISFLGMASILIRHIYQKERPAYLEKSDKAIYRWLDQGKDLLGFINKKTWGLLFHYVIEGLENFFIKVFRKLKSLVKKH